MKHQRTVQRLLGVIALDQTYIEFALPIITLLFFDPASRLFSADTPMAVRSMWYGVCISIPYFINLFFAPLLSTLSDEFGRRKFLLFEIISAFFYMLCAALATVTGQLWLLICGFVIRGAFSRTNTTALAMIGDACTKHKKMAYMGYLQLAISTGACIGPFISGFLAGRFWFDTLNFSLPFFVAAVLALINAVLTYHYIDETLENKSSQAFGAVTGSRLKANLHAIRYVITHPDILKTSLMLILSQITWATYYQFMPPLLKTAYHFNAGMLGVFIGMIAFWLIVAAGLVFNIVHSRWNNHKILNYSAVLEIIGIAFVAAVYWQQLPEWFLWASALPVAVGDMLIYICLTSTFSNVVADHMQGKVMGINFMIVGLTWGGTGFLGGLLIGYSIILPLVLAPCGIFAFLLFINTDLGRKMVLSYNYST